MSAQAPGNGAELHISSLVVHARPDALPAVRQQLAALPGARLHASDARGKLVVTLETPSAETTTEQMQTLQRSDGVLAVTLVYQCADSLEAMNETMSQEVQGGDADGDATT